MTFRPPGATPISVAAKPATGQQAPAPEPAAPVPQTTTKSAGPKALWIVLGVAVLAAAGVAAGWFLTQ